MPPRPGHCQVCGCTDRYGCPAGCWWVDRAHTLCSVCLQNLSVMLAALIRRGELARVFAVDDPAPAPAIEPEDRVGALGEPGPAVLPAEEGM